MTDYLDAPNACRMESPSFSCAILFPDTHGPTAVLNSSLFGKKCQWITIYAQDVSIHQYPKWLRYQKSQPVLVDTIGKGELHGFSIPENPNYRNKHILNIAAQTSQNLFLRLGLYQFRVSAPIN